MSCIQYLEYSVGPNLFSSTVPIQDVLDTFDKTADEFSEMIDYVKQVHVRGVAARRRRRAQPARFPPDIRNVYNYVISGEERTITL